MAQCNCFSLYPIPLYNYRRPPIRLHCNVRTHTFLIFLCYQVDVVTASSRTQVNQVHQELETYKERSAALENSLRNRIFALECSVETNQEEQENVKESNGADDLRVQALEKTCEELRQALVESQTLFNNMQTVAEAEKDALTDRKSVV